MKYVVGLLALLVDVWAWFLAPVERHQTEKEWQSGSPVSPDRTGWPAGCHCHNQRGAVSHQAGWWWCPVAGPVYQSSHWVGDRKQSSYRLSGVTNQSATSLHSDNQSWRDCEIFSYHRIMIQSHHLMVSSKHSGQITMLLKVSKVVSHLTSFVESWSVISHYNFYTAS